jgi:mono/diheme cytochrome c family protein
MNAFPRFVSLAAAIALGLAAARVGAELPTPAKLVGDVQRGAALHGGCFSCHGTERYTAPVTNFFATLGDSVLRASGLSDLPPAEPKRFKGRAKSLDHLREAVWRRNAYMDPPLSPQEVEDLVAYLNATYYKFPSANKP